MKCKRCRKRGEFSAGYKICKKCRAKAGRKYYARASVKKAKQSYNKKRRQTTASARRLKFYGLTPEKYEAMLVEQKGECAICHKVMAKPCIDHCHATGKVRQLLCDRCNQGLGFFDDDPARLNEAADYVSFWKAMK